MILSVAEAFYRILYGGLLLRLPESQAVHVGQVLLRHLPLPAVRGLAPADPRLGVDLAGVRLPNPVILSSMYYDAAILRRAMALGFGAVTTKSITLASRPGHPEPNLRRILTPDGPGFVNCNGFRNPGLPAFRAALETLPHRCPVIVSIAGESPAEYRQLAEGLEALADLLELNISSPNTRLVYELSTSAERVRALFKEVRAATTKPVLVKLSPDYPEENRRTLVPAALDAGIDGINFGNTHRVEDTRLSQGAGGLSGPALYANLLATLPALRRLLGPRPVLVATGGIDTPEKAVRAIEAGADAISYFSAFITRGPTFPRRIAEALGAALDRRGVRSLRELRGI